MPQRSLAVNNGAQVGANAQISPANKNKVSQPIGEPSMTNNNNNGKSAVTSQSFASSTSGSHGPADSKLNSSTNSSAIPSETSGAQDEENYSETSQDHDEQDQRAPRFNFREVDTTLTKVFVGGLAWQTKSETLQKHFSQYGDILEAVVIMDKNTGRSKGFGFVTFADGDSAQRATANPNPVIDSRRANCNLAALGLTRRRAAAHSPSQTHQKMPSRDGSDYEPLFTVPAPMSMALQYSLPGSGVAPPYTMSQSYSSPQPSQSEYADGSNPMMVPQVYYNPTLIGYDANQQPVYSFLPSSPFFSPASYYYSPSVSSASPGYRGFNPTMVQVPVSPGVPVQVGVNQLPPPLSLPQLHPLIGTESTESMGSQVGTGAPGLSRGKSDTSEASAPEFYDGTGDSPKPVNLASVSSSLAFCPPQRIPMQQRGVMNANNSPVPVAPVDGGEYGRNGMNFNRMAAPVQTSAQFVPMMAPPMYFSMPAPPVGRMHMGQGPRGRHDTVPRFQRMNIHDAEAVSTADPSN